jgi:hypothetical protein
LYIKNKADQYTDGMATFTHEELILLATNKYNLLVQTGEWGAKTLEEENIVTMQAELTALKGQFALGPKLRAAAGDKDGAKKDDDKKGDQGGKKKNKKNTASKRNQKENDGNVSCEESQGLHFLLVQASYVLGWSQRKGM